MTLMGTWITGYWNGNELEAGKDYDFFPFPAIADGVPVSVVGPVDGLVISNDGENRAGAEAFLSFMMSNADVQASWTGAYGALSANVNVDPANYSDVMQRVSTVVGAADNFRVQLRTLRRRRRWRRSGSPCSRASWTTRARWTTSSLRSLRTRHRRLRSRRGFVGAGRWATFNRRPVHFPL